MADSTCSVTGCGRVVNGRGWCAGHYRRFRLTGDVAPDVPLANRSSGTMADRLWGRVTKTESCWLWTGYVNSLGYGRIALPRNGGPVRSAQAHRVAYELLVGPIPEGLVLDHLCRNPSCVNPAHLEPVSDRENILRGVSPSAANAAKDECAKGHRLDDANTYRHAYRRVSGAVAEGRQCRACRAERGANRDRDAERQRVLDAMVEALTEAAGSLR